MVHEALHGYTHGEVYNSRRARNINTTTPAYYACYYVYTSFIKSTPLLVRTHAQPLKGRLSVVNATVCASLRASRPAFM